MPLHTVFFTRSLLISFTQRKSLAHFFSCMCLYALRLTRARDHTRAFTHKYIQKLLRAKSCTTPPKNTQVLVHTKTVYRFFYMQELLCANVFTWFFAHNPVIRKKCAQEASHQDALTHTQKHTHTHGIFYTKNVSTQKDFPTHNLLQKLSHTFFTNRCFHTHKL